jgi:hypothetical protein
VVAVGLAAVIAVGPGARGEEREPRSDARHISSARSNLASVGHQLSSVCRRRNFRSALEPRDEDVPDLRGRAKYADGRADALDDLQSSLIGLVPVALLHRYKPYEKALRTQAYLFRTMARDARHGQGDLVKTTWRNLDDARRVRRRHAKHLHARGC